MKLKDFIKHTLAAIRKGKGGGPSTIVDFDVAVVVRRGKIEIAEDRDNCDTLSRLKFSFVI